MRARPWRAVLFVALVVAGAVRAQSRATPNPAARYRDTPFWHMFDAAAQALDQRIGWHRLPRLAGLLTLVGLRNILRRQNLYDTATEPFTGGTIAPPFDATVLVGRTPDGTYNDLEHPTMGARGTRFGRNIPLEAVTDEALPGILEPNPRTISRELLTRTEFVPATSLNQLATAWIQFMVKDWFSHGEGDPEHHWELPLDADDPWPERPMKILKTLPDPTQAPGRIRTFNNTETHWWDVSQIYATTVDGQNRRRVGREGKLFIGEDGRLLLPDDPTINPALIPGWWVGLNMLASLFIREHNAVCDRLRAEYPAWSDEELFQRARLVVSALVAKIHTIDWTPAIIAHPITVSALRANWWGLAGERVRKTFGRLGKDEVISGIPGSETDHYGVPFSLTEEFTIVYRMHPLTVDDYTFRSALDDRILLETDLRHLTGLHAQQVVADVGLGNLFYSLGTSHPGALVLNNFPRFLQEFQRPDREDVFMDLAAIDILRAREFGVPRYNEFRRLLHMKPVASFTELAEDPTLAARISDVYGGDIERVDLMIGMFAERRPAGFGFSDTAFRVFILMASRRLNSDRFFTENFNPEIYTPAGFDWVQNNSMVTVLLRHHPELRAALRNTTNAFQPWTRISNGEGR